MKVNIEIDEYNFQIPIEGQFFQGPAVTLYNKHKKLLEHCTWEESGYSIYPLWDQMVFQEIKTSVTSAVRRVIESLGIDCDDQFCLEQYHNYVLSDETHQQVIAQTRFFTRDTLQLNIHSISDALSKKMNISLSPDNPLLNEEIVIVRISRPSSLDINPPHRDGYLPIWENILNVWIPIAGCNEKSSLPVMPGSHKISEDKVIRTDAGGAKLNALKYHVPAIVDVEGGLKLVRPNPAYGSVLVFTPFLIHGAAINQQTNQTRVSLELRLFHDNK